MLRQALCCLAILAVMTFVAQAAAPAAAAPDIVVVQAGRLLDRPGRAPRGPSTIVIRDGRVSEVLDGFVDVPGSLRTRCWP